MTVSKISFGSSFSGMVPSFMETILTVSFSPTKDMGNLHTALILFKHLSFLFYESGHRQTTFCFDVESRGIADFETTVDRGSVVNFGADSRLCLS